MIGLRATEANLPRPEEPMPQPPQPELPPKKPSEPELPSPDPGGPPFPGPDPTDPGLPQPVSYFLPDLVANGYVMAGSVPIIIVRVLRSGQSGKGCRLCSKIFV